MSEKFKIRTRKLSELTKSKYNPRKISKADFEQLRVSIETFGFVQPIVINSNPDRKDVIIGGHQKIEVAKILKITEVPCVEINLDEKSEKELNLRLNRNQGDFDNNLLKNFEKELLSQSGFNFKELEEIFKETVDELETTTYSDMELQPYESHDYIVLIFENTFDWLNAVQLLEIEDVNHSILEDNKKIGIGRVINGEKFLNKFFDKKDNSK